MGKNDRMTCPIIIIINIIIVIITPLLQMDVVLHDHYLVFILSNDVMILFIAYCVLVWLNKKWQVSTKNSIYITQSTQFMVHCVV